ncbi:MAG: hypothetical protein CV045_02975, partial [Cyanobacteria bacterium M5B4]
TLKNKLYTQFSFVHFTVSPPPFFKETSFNFTDLNPKGNLFFLGKEEFVYRQRERQGVESGYFLNYKNLVFVSPTALFGSSKDLGFSKSLQYGSPMAQIELQTWKELDWLNISKDEWLEVEKTTWFNYVINNMLE